MLHTSELVAIPPDPGYNQKKGQYINRFIYLKHYRVLVKGVSKVRHDVLLIGRVVTDPETNVQCLMSNDNYFSHYRIEPSHDSILKGRGAMKKSNSSKVASYSDNGNGSILGFGLGIACFQIAKETHLEAILTEIFDADTARDILGLAMFYCDDYVGLTELEDFTAEQMCFTDRVLTPQIAGEIFRSITDVQRDSFFKKWIPLQAPDGLVCYDVTSVSSYSQRIDGIEYGYNRDKEKLPQMNIGMFTDIETGVPLAYESYNGSINDFTNFPYVINKAVSWGLKNNFVLIMDGGFAEDFAINYSQFEGYDLIVGAPVDKMSEVKNRLIAWRKSNTDHLSMAQYRFDSSIKCKDEEFELAPNVNGRLLLYFNADKYTLQCTSLQMDIERQKTILEELKKISPCDAKKFNRYFDITVNEDRSFSYKIKTDAISDDLHVCGSLAIMTTSQKLSVESILRCYCNKDVVEKRFRDLKNEIMGERVRVHSTEACKGKLFVLFISLILRTTLSIKLRDWVRKNRYSLIGCIHQLKNIQCRKTGQNWILSKALTKKQKEISEILKLPVHSLDVRK